MKLQKVLVTGAAGFIGSAVMKELLDSGYEVLGIDSFTDFYSPELKRERIESLLEKDSRLIEVVDIAHYNELETILKKFVPEVIIHLAAQPGVRLPIKEVDRYVQSNLVGHTNMIRACIEYGVERFIYASSSSVYGDVSPLPYKENSMLLSPKSFYGLSKLQNEIATKLLCANHQISSRGLRFFTVYGPWGRPDMAYFRLMANALGKADFVLFGDGKIKRDFTFIKDVTRTTVKLMQELSVRNSGFHDVVNIGGQRPLSMEYLMSQVSLTVNSELSYKIASTDPSDSLETAADNSYLLSLIGEQNFTPLEQGIDLFAQWMKSEKVLSRVSNWIKSVP